MAGNSVGLVTDVNSKPAPQYYNDTADAYEYLTGADGASNVRADSRITAPTAYNVTLTSANTEYSQALPANCRGFEFQCRTGYDVRFAFVTGKVATPTAPYWTLKADRAYSSFQINQGATPSTLYLASAQAGVIVEILAWT